MALFFSLITSFALFLYIRSFCCAYVSHYWWCELSLIMFTGWQEMPLLDLIVIVIGKSNLAMLL